jgi:hypothetical protein
MDVGNESGWVVLTGAGIAFSERKSQRTAEGSTEHCGIDYDVVIDI